MIDKSPQRELARVTIPSHREQTMIYDFPFSFSSCMARVLLFFFLARFLLLFFLLVSFRRFRSREGSWEDVEADGVEKISCAGEHADDAAVEHGQIVVRAVYPVAERPVAAEVGHDLDGGDATLHVLEREWAH